MRDISKYTPNAQKYIRYGWAACEEKDDEEFERILDEREKFYDKYFTLEDYDSMIEDTRTSPLECNMWRRERARYIAEHQQKLKLEDMKKQGNFKEAR